MARKATTEFGEAWRAIGFSEAELVEFLGLTPAAVKHMSGGRTPVSEAVMDKIAEVARMLEEGSGNHAGIPDGPRRRREIVKGLVERARGNPK
ncbi:hypothetical protein [Aureimonas glaciei]|uniref:Uncharacterized protein n=1 Tax=Aureimonas glaciei TaxID=1776957 RepID=A0A916Y5D2_9HYPH|nr:hypothetical protein [Aureimonas glaciei]GGD31545.1 hypothetical protein GCM10011335_38230 [Aureimonas glaciei]